LQCSENRHEVSLSRGNRRVAATYRRARHMQD
jgi:hypothetical protein